MSSANGGTYAGQYQCDGWVDLLTSEYKRTPQLRPETHYKRQSLTIRLLRRDRRFELSLLFQYHY